jgi:hypothetical protein
MSWASRREARSDAVRSRILAALEAHPNQPAAVVARCAGMNPASLYHHLIPMAVDAEVLSLWGVESDAGLRRRLYRLSNPDVTS